MKPTTNREDYLHKDQVEECVFIVYCVLCTLPLSDMCLLENTVA